MNQLLARVKDGKLEYSKTEISEILSGLEGKQILISFDVWHGKPTLPQLGYYFGGIVSKHHKEFGYTKDEFYSALIEHCGKVEVTNQKTGVIEYLPKSVSKRNKMQMMELIDNVIRFLGENSIRVQTPEEYYSKMQAQADRST